MKKAFALIETYLMVLVHPYKLHQQFRFSLPIPHHEGHLYQPLTLAESLGISWIFAIIKGISKILILNFFLQAFMSMQNDSMPLVSQLLEQSGISTYYFLLFSVALDIIFFPVLTLIATEFWAWVIKFYAGQLDVELPKEEIADQVTTHALSSHLFSVIPFVGDVIQSLVYIFLIYAGLRSNLGASRSLATVIILTPTLLLIMAFSLIAVTLFYFVS
jgi:hypothetical protein